MIKENFSANKRSPKKEYIEADLAITGGGMAGTCCAITAAREGLKVVLVQDRPVLGGNASSEIRLWILGATSHMGNNNRWAREGGVIDEILVENMFRNPEGNPLILDTILLEKVAEEKNIKLLLNTSVYELEKKSADEIKSLQAFCSQTYINYTISAPFFLDASGDGITAFMAGAAFRMGAESPDEYNEKFAPDHEYGELLGHSMYFYSKDTGKPVKFIPPSYALTDIEKLPRFRSFNLKDHGCRLWWVEYGGRMDTIHDSEIIKWEIWRVLYGIWNYIKNSGEYKDSENLTLEWVGTIPGKRESRRFEGDYILHQRDVVEQSQHYDAVSYGGWALDLHPADGVFGDKPGCNQWHSKGVYQIPYRCFYSKNIKNLFLAGRIISASHVAFGSTRVMATCSHGAQAVAIAAKLCLHQQLSPRQLSSPGKVSMLQQELIKTGQYIPRHHFDYKPSLVESAKITCSSEFKLQTLPADGPWYRLQYPVAQLIPLPAGEFPKISILVKSEREAKINVELRKSSKLGNFTPDIILHSLTFSLTKGETSLTIPFNFINENPQYIFVCIMKNEDVWVKCSDSRCTGLLTTYKKYNKAVSNFGKQEPPENIGIESFEFWIPQRRPEGQNLAFEINEPLSVYSITNLINGIFRPTTGTNAWAGALDDPHPTVTLEWPIAHEIEELILYFDTDYDHPMESTLLGHTEREIPFCVKKYQVQDNLENVIFNMEHNHQTINRIKFKEKIKTNGIKIILEHPASNIPAALFGINVF